MVTFPIHEGNKYINARRGNDHPTGRSHRLRLRLNEHPERPTECRMPKARQRSTASSPDRRSKRASPATVPARPAAEARSGEPTAGGWAGDGSKTLRSDVLVPAREVGREGSAVLCCVVGLKGARRWRLLWSLQRPLSERSEEMSLSGRQRRGAFKMCWIDTDLIIVPSSIEVLSSVCIAVALITVVLPPVCVCPPCMQDVVLLPGHPPHNHLPATGAS